jgi:hypothetical protein
MKKYRIAIEETLRKVMEKAYTFAQMRQIVREKGHKPSLRNYKRELKQINIIQ